MFDKSKVGQSFPPFTIEVERAKIRELALAIGDPNPIYHSREAAQAAGYKDTPLYPTSPTTFNFWGNRKGGNNLSSVGINVTRILHGEEEYEYLAPIYPGDIITGVTSILDGKNRPFTGAEFLESLRDGREVYIYGERVKDVTRHPAFRNSAASIALLYDGIHDKATKDVLTAPTDTGSGGYTHKFFKVAHSREEVIAQRDAIAAWARISYGWLGRSPDYKAAFLNTLGANAEFYGKFADNARAWHKRAQEAVLYLNHALVNPPIDRNKPVEEVKDVYITIQKETDAGIYVSGAKVVATNSALTHYNFLGQNMGQEITDPAMVVMFIAPMNTPGIKIICRPSYEFAAAATGSPWDYPLTSRFDENDAIFVFDNAFIPWENVIIHRDFERLKNFYPQSGFFNGFTLQGCTRLAVKLDFIAGLLYKAARATGVPGRRVVIAHLLPNAIGVVVTSAALQVGGAILTEASLAFVGLGDPTVISWGRMLNDAQPFLRLAWWMSVFPGIALVLTVLGTNLLGEALYGIWDPTRRRTVPVA